MRDVKPGTEHLHERLRKVHQELANTMIERRLCAARLMVYETEVAELQQAEAALHRAIDGASQPGDNSAKRAAPRARRRG